MPTYDYQCRTCGHTIEVIHPMSEDGPTSCEVCGGPLRRVIFPAGIIFKGSGFYKTDSRSSSSSSSHATGRTGGGTSSDGEAPAAPDAKSDGDAKPAAGSTNASSGSSSVTPPPSGESKSS